ncbi:MAG: Na+/H+ antiporter subunit E [Gemmatimonadales bacterium]
MILFAFWLVLSGHYTPLLLTLGLLSSAAVAVVARRMRVIDREGLPIQLAWRLLRYVPWLLKEILVASVRVARIILTPRLPISPVVAIYHSSQRTDLGRALYGNSITLTPGTITMGIRGDQLEVHSLTWVHVHEGEEDAMDRRVTWVERGGGEG